MGQPPSPGNVSVPGLQSRAEAPESPQAPSRLVLFHLTQLPGGLGKGGWESNERHYGAKCCETEGEKRSDPSREVPQDQDPVADPVTSDHAD